MLVSQFRGHARIYDQGARLLNEKTDEELMIAYQLGEAEAFAALYSRHASRVLGYLRKKTGSDALARDVFQSTFLKLHRCRSRYDAAFPFVPWLFTICRSELLDALKKAHRRHETLAAEVPENVAPAADLGTPEVNLSRLPPAQQRAVELRYGNDFSFDEIAAQLDTSPANARKLVSRAIRFLRGAHGKR
jgi:RNA polymerase sigma-70 factor (ECF subfamily)